MLTRLGDRKQSTATVVNVSEVVRSGPEVSRQEQARARIAEVAAEVLARDGRDAVSTRAVAAAAGTQVPTIYRLFGDKAGLLAAVAEQGYAAYLAAKPRPLAAADPVAELRAGWDLHIEFGLANPGLFALMYGDPQPDRPSHAALTAFDLLRGRIQTIAASGRLRIDARLAADMVHATACGTVMTLLATPVNQRNPALSSTTFDVVVTAITTDPTALPAPGPVPAANTLRAHLPDLVALTDGERHVLQEWLTRITTRAPSPADPPQPPPAHGQAAPVH